MIEFRDVSHRFGDLQLFNRLNFSAAADSVTCLLGPSGSGKTTMLKMMAALLHPDSGRIESPRNISFVFQESRLLPWYPVRDNAAYAMDHRMHSGERNDRVDGMLEMMELSDAADKLPSEISGGMARRCALARALLAPSDALLLDEPLSSLDPDMKARILRRLPVLLRGKTVVLVTHDHGTAVTLSDRVYRLSDAPVRMNPVEKSDLEGILHQIEIMDLEAGINPSSG